MQFLIHSYYENPILDLSMRQRVRNAQYIVDIWNHKAFLRRRFIVKLVKTRKVLASRPPDFQHDADDAQPSDDNQRSSTRPGGKSKQTRVIEYLITCEHISLTPISGPGYSLFFNDAA